MPALDIYHPQVVNALQKAGWAVSTGPYVIRVPGRKRPLYADLSAQLNTSKIIVAEIKCFQIDPRGELYTAIGQYLVYRALLNQLGISHELYLAVPSSAYHGIFRDMGMVVINETKIKLIVVDIEQEVIEQWLG